MRTRQICLAVLLEIDGNTEPVTLEIALQQGGKYTTSMTATHAVFTPDGRRLLLECLDRLRYGIVDHFTDEGVSS